MRAPPGSPPVPSGFDALLGQTVFQLESRVAHVATTASAIATALVLASIASGSPIPRIILAATLFFFAWYACVALLMRAGRYRPWMRYASSLVDVSMGTVVALLDLRVNGPAFALSAGGPALYAVGVVMSTPRLQPRLCLFAGLAAAAQLLVLVQFVLRPAASPELLASGAFDFYVTLAKSIFLVTSGALGMVASRSMRGLLVRLTESAVERERVRGLLGMHVSEQVMEHLLSGRMPEGGERRAVTICFTDIRDFTRLSESQSPEETLRLLNLYFGRMCEIVAAHGGLVNKFLGDGMLIVFGAPTHQPDDARRALAAAREMLAEAELMRERGEFPDLRIGVALHRGEAVVGNVGGAQRQEYTVIGDTVNTTSRVQDLTKALGRALLLTRECREALGDEATFEPLGAHAVKGRLQQLELFGIPERGSSPVA
ncbi:adenylate/guanylate cyclase domain-containing protein [Vitiosangium sp. GDMCC 1.1324]|uniref:adenylate/guanylate cyclase domain-containing protein n=1 Tax=Vitiosangium sp. (strain GDMCC 1.1324) TaxID=2138576 RepID=UPI000D33D486|nr:adenylate/guanylate cyclase domain-containing protein [Vitiosangium sp. GDMCC 1.1324]PTL77025.1 adenylate/guanylate cyclase domain-containing protein [Vitiosangium sp. GDMCC 1.1324]